MTDNLKHDWKNPKTQAYSWEALSGITIFTMFIQIIGERFMATAGQVPNLTMAQQLSAFFLSMLSPIFWLNIAPTVCYITAMWHLAGIFRAISKGEEFTKSIISGLQKTGSNLLLGSSFAILISPTLINWLSGHGAVAFHANSENLLILLLGGTLVMLSKQGEKMRNELEEIL